MTTCVDATKELVRVNDLEGCYIRPLVYLGYGEMGLNPLPCRRQRVHRGAGRGARTSATRASPTASG